MEGENLKKQWEVVEEPKDGGEVVEVFVGGQVKKAELLSDHSSSFGVFMHSLTLSNEITPASNQYSKGNELSEDEQAISQYTQRNGFDKGFLEKIAPRVGNVVSYEKDDIIPAVHRINEKYRMIAKGNPLYILERCTHIFMDTGVYKITRKLARAISEVFWDMVERGLRVYALAIRDTAKLSEVAGARKVSNGMTLVGLVGIKRKNKKELENIK